MSSDQSGEPPLLQEEADPGPETGGKDEALLGSEGGSGGMVSEAFFSELALSLSDCCSLDSILRPLFVMIEICLTNTKIKSNKTRFR